MSHMPAFMARRKTWQIPLWMGLFWFALGPIACRNSIVLELTNPPIILITLDTTRRDALSMYNPDIEHTPNLQEFANGATVFDHAYATAPWTLPSHASMFSGLFPSRHGAGVSQMKFSEQFPTLPALLQVKGYRTIGLSGGPFTDSRYGLSRGFEMFADSKGEKHSADRLVAKAKGFINQANGESFFLFMNFFDAHAPYHPPPAYQKMFKLKNKQKTLESLPRWKDNFGKYGLRVQKLRTMGVAEPEAADYLHAAYASEIAFLDHHFGRMMAYLKSKNLYDQALIVVVADHGEFLGENGRYLHSYSLDPLLTHIPMIVKWPEQVVGSRNPALVSQVDLFSTVLESAKLEIPANDGESLREIPLDPTRWVLMEEHKFSPIHPLASKDDLIADHLYGIQTLHVRGVVWEGQNRCERLDDQHWAPTACGHDWQKDIAFINQFLKVDPPQPGQEEIIDEHEAEVLRSLGYIQ